MKIYLGIDWGGTYIKAGLVNSKGKVIKKNVFSSPELKKREVFIDKLKSLLNKLDLTKIKGIGIGAPGVIDTKKGFIYYLPNIKGWRNFPLKDILQKHLNLPVFVDNDANVFALAELRLGSARGAKRVIFLTLGTGLGSAVILDGKILEGRTSAAELGHVPISLDGKLCNCGGRGCIETFVGNKFLLEKYKQLKKSKSDAQDVKNIFEKALRGEREALLVWEEFSRSLGMFLAGMINIFNPEIIVLGGGISGAVRIFKPLLWQAIKHQVMWPHLKGLKIVKARLRNAGIIGAALLAKENLEVGKS
jgi:glucokinase